MKHSHRPYAVLVLFAIIVAGCGSTTPTTEPVAPVPDSVTPAATPSPTEAASLPVPLDPAVIHGQLANGLTFYIRTHDEPRERAELRLAVNAGSILVRQRGTPFTAGLNVGRGKDDTLFALATGKVQFETKGKNKKFVSIIPS